jgi:hypothetical protein
MSISSWVGSVWSLRGVDGPVVGQVHAVDGDVLTLAVVGLGDQPLDGVELVPSDTGGRPLARVSAETLLGRWSRLGRAST